MLAAFSILASCVALIVFEESIGWSFAFAPIIIFFIALFSEYVDSALGMGYGTILTPVLILMGIPPLEIVPAVLLSEFLSGLIATLGHQMSGNVDLRHGSRSFNVAMTLGACSFVGTLSAVLIAVNVPKDTLTTMIGMVILLIGIAIIAFAHHKFVFSWPKIIALGVVASFNKGLSGGGYGPLITGGQVLAGVNGKSAIAVASFAEALTCIVGLAVYFFSGNSFSWHLAVPILLGACCSVPLSVMTVRVMKTRLLTITIGVLTFALGALMLLNLG